LCKNYPVTGRIVTVDHEISESYLLPRIASGEGGRRPIANARVYLAFDHEGAKPVPGYEVQSEGNGLYLIDTRDIPRAQLDYQRYVLVVEKNGYQSLRQEIGLRFLSPYVNNTVVLKALEPDRGKEGANE
jgi:hypothetical protein